MKKIICLLFFLLFPVIFPVSAQDNGRKLTIMVYMCGSNLESQNGSATKDIMEMQNAGIARKEVSLLVMTGGSENWEMGFDPSRIYIYEISSRGSRIIWESDAMNMGSRNTLTQLLKFGKENRPAERYALILWDHGGGPLEGACWDEVFSPDKLDLKEITEGIENADLGQKLSWIGFDACLMSSVETAAALAPYAEYMIASQETEPATGWNYSFLKGIENDADGGATGKRIIDAYFEGQEEQKDILTLACTDLGKAAEAIEAFGDFFTPISASVDEENFANLSGIRLASTGFGKAVRGFGDTGYDLVDAMELVSRLNTDGAGTELLGKLKDAVVYSRANEEGANGLSLYHPYMNKDKYLISWRDGYSRLGFDEGYTQYIKNFGTILTGAELVDWSGLNAVLDGMDEEGVNHLSMQLTPEQAANVSSVQLLILSNWTAETFYYEDDLMAYDPNELSWMLVSSDKVELDENGIVHGDYDGSMLFIENEAGKKIGPLGFQQTDDGKYNVIQVIYKSAKDNRQTEAVQYYLPADKGIRNPEVSRIRVWDSVTESYTNRIDFQEEDFDNLIIVDYTHKYPSRNNNGALPGFEDWELDSDMTSWNPVTVNKNIWFDVWADPYDYTLEEESKDYQVVIDKNQAYRATIALPDAWKFYMSDRQIVGEQLFAVFQVTDLQQNVYCSAPIPIRAPSLVEHEIISEPYEFGDLRFELSWYIDESQEYPRLVQIMRLTNLADSERRFVLDSTLINDEYFIEYDREFIIGSQKFEVFGRGYVFDELVFLDSISSFSFCMKIYPDPEDKDHFEETVVRFETEKIDVSSHFSPLSVLAETDSNLISVRLVSLNPFEDGGFKGILYVNNRSDKAYDFAKTDILLNGTQTQSQITGTSAIPAGMSGSIEFLYRNTLTANGFYFPVSTANTNQSWFSETVLAEHILQNQGFNSVSDMDIIFRNEDYDITDIIHLQLKKPWQIQTEAVNNSWASSIKDMIFPKTIESGSGNQCSPMAENNQYSVCMERMVLGDRGLALSLEVRNKTGEPLILVADDPFINGEAAAVWFRGEYSLGDYLYFSSRGVPVDAVVIVSPHSNSFIALYIMPESQLPENGITDISVSFRSREQRPTDKVIIQLPDPGFTGKAGGQWYEAEELSIRSVRTPDVEAVNGIEQPLFETDISHPEDAGSYIRFIEIPLSEEQKSELLAAAVFIVYLPSEDSQGEPSDEYLVYLTKKNFIAGDIRRYGTDVVFLVPCFEYEDSAEAPIPMNLAEINPTENGFYSDSMVQFKPIQYMSKGVSADLEIEWNLKTNRTEIRKIVLEDDVFNDRVHADYYCQHYILFTKTYNPDNTLDYILSERFFIPDTCIPLYGKPVRMGLHPLEEIDSIDHFAILFKVLLKDERIYSLPLIPVSEIFGNDKFNEIP